MDRGRERKGRWRIAAGSMEGEKVREGDRKMERETIREDEQRQREKELIQRERQADEGTCKKVKKNGKRK